MKRLPFFLSVTSCQGIGILRELFINLFIFEHKLRAYTYFLGHEIIVKLTIMYTFFNYFLKIFLNIKFIVQF